MATQEQRIKKLEAEVKKLTAELKKQKTAMAATEAADCCPDVKKLVKYVGGPVTAPQVPLSQWVAQVHAMLHQVCWANIQAAYPASAPPCSGGGTPPQNPPPWPP